MINIKLLLVILDEGYDKKLNNLLNKFKISFKTVSNASGTASSSLLEYFGLTETKKELFLSIIPDYLGVKILDRIKKEFNLGKEGTGIAFIVPISSSNKFLSEEYRKENPERRNSIMQEKENNKYHLIISIVLEGYLEQVMSAAKKAGCFGGTVINGRGLGSKNSKKFFGFNIEPGREIIINVVSENDKNRVMEEITKEVGMKTKGKGICFSLPIEEVIGLEKYIES